MEALKGRVGFVRFVGFVGVLLLLVARLHAQPQPPELTKPVNDFANVIDAESEAEIERRILELKNASGDIVVVATIDTFQPYADIREYAVTMFENRGRGIGAKGKDNGLLILVAVKDRRVWAEVGYDLEQFITDGYAGEVSRTDMAPYFARGEYGPGVLAGASRIIGRIAQGRGVTLNNVPIPETQPTAGIQVSPWVILAIVILVMLINNAGGGRRSRMRRGGPHWGGGNWSGWNSGVGPFGGGGRFGGGGFGGGFGGFGGGRSGGGGGGAGW
ncbi:MAG TPA: TPM domain-containing protein [Vicinamibacterales bacterium]|nr:TPM domain-containing protein [Vicinamibacterales bacterium]